MNNVIRFPILVLKKGTSDEYEESWVDIDIDSIRSIEPAYSDNASELPDRVELYTDTGYTWKVLMTPVEIQAVLNYTPRNLYDILKTFNL